MKKLLLLSVLVLALAGAGFWFYGKGEKAPESPYRFVAVERGALESLVSSTGILSAVTTVQVGTQVSGRVDRLFVDFNDRVHRGQLLAYIDTTLLVSAIRDAEANLERSQAQLAQAGREYERLKGLHDKKIVTDVEYNKALYDLESARATVKSATINLERAQQNLQYAAIRAPMDGTVVERNVDVGQTVAASFSAPQLFLIANDLTQMQILASVDESDIGRIREGQDVRFTVQSYSDETFRGRVRQIRLQSKTEQNVVSYTVVVDVKNDEGKLLPGMTASVEFLIAHEDDVLKIPNAALRFRPTPEMWEALRAQREPRGSADSSGGRRAVREGRPQGSDGARRAVAGGGTAPGGWNAGGPGGPQGRADVTMLWFVDAQGQVTARPVRTGISDGQFTQILSDDLKEGMQVITGVNQGAAPAASPNPFQQQQQRGGPPRGF